MSGINEKDLITQIEIQDTQAFIMMISEEMGIDFFDTSEDIDESQPEY